MNARKRFLLAGGILFCGIAILGVWEKTASPPAAAGKSDPQPRASSRVGVAQPSSKSGGAEDLARGVAVQLPPVHAPLDVVTLQRLNTRVHEIASEAQKAQAIIDAASANVKGTIATRSLIEPFVQGVVTAELLQDDLFGMIIEDSLKDSTVFEQCSDVAPASGRFAPAKC